jgi:hypothetical protein
MRGFMRLLSDREPLLALARAVASRQNSVTEGLNLEISSERTLLHFFFFVAVTVFLGFHEADWHPVRQSARPALCGTKCASLLPGLRWF